MPRDAVNHLDAQLLLVYLLTTPRCSTKSARRRLSRWSSRVRSSAEVTPNGGFATTRNEAVGQRKSRTSPATILTGLPANRDRSCRTLSGCNSTARTSAPAATNAAVSTPVPAPTSTTRAPGSMPALSTIWRAQSGSSRCQPHRCDASGWSADTTHHHEHDHCSTVPLRAAVPQQVFRGANAPPTPVDHGVLHIYWPHFVRFVMQCTMINNKGGSKVGQISAVQCMSALHSAAQVRSVRRGAGPSEDRRANRFRRHCVRTGASGRPV